MAQHARPHWYTHMEYRRDVFSSAGSDLGSLPLSTRPISRYGLYPTKDSLAPGIEQPEGQHEDEGAHLDGPERAVRLQARGPGEDEHGLDIEHHEEDREDVIADLGLHPAGADGVHTRLVIQVLARLPPGRTDQRAEAEHAAHEGERDPAEDGDREV